MLKVILLQASSFYCFKVGFGLVQSWYEVCLTVVYGRLRAGKRCAKGWYKVGVRVVYNRFRVGLNCSFAFLGLLDSRSVCVSIYIYICMCVYASNEKAS